MGMFDYVKHKAHCENCGEPMKEFQSKDGPCLLKKLKPAKVDNFYGTCTACGAWHDFKVKRACRVKSIKVEVRKGTGA